MTHRKEHVHVSSIATPSADNEGSISHFVRALVPYIRRHWAWPAIIVLWWFNRKYHFDSNKSFAVFILLTVFVVIVGWKQLATNSYWRGYFGILLGFAGLMVFIGAFPVIFLLCFVGVVGLTIDLFFVAPHRRL